MTHLPPVANPAEPLPGLVRQHFEVLGPRPADKPPAQPLQRNLGFGRIVVSEIEVLNMFAIPV